MTSSGSPAAEQARRDALDAYEGGEPEPALDEIVRRAVNLCRAPIASISFYRDDVWTVSSVGIAPFRVAPTQSFCETVVRSAKPLAVHDASNHPDFSRLPLVTGSPFARSYLGVPLTSPLGAIVGALCVIDTKKRKFSDRNREDLEFLARQIILLLELRRTRSALQSTQKELIRQHQTLVETKRQNRDVLSNLSHEIRNPLHAMMGIADILKEQDLGAHPIHLLRNLANSGQHMMETLDTILEHSKIESGQIKLNPSLFDLQPFMEETLAPFAALAQEKGLAFSTRINLPSECLCHADRVRLRQILGNLTHNALKFTDSGFIRVEVECSDARYDQCLFSFKIIDSGIGIDSAGQNRLFEPFRQVSGDASKGGSGLGLSICRKIVESMDGQIGVESESGRGSTFWFMLALRTAAPIVPLVPGASSPRKLQGRVLLLEDNSLSSAMAVSYLEKAGLDVLVASTLDECVCRLDSHSFDIILMDLHLGSVLPATLLHEVRMKSCAPIIAISGSAVDPKKGLECGIDDSLQKPFGKDALLDKLDAWIMDANELSTLSRDWQHSLGRLYEQCGSDFVKSTIDTFVARHPGEVQKLHRYLEEGYWDKLELTAHSMKSTLATLGLMHLAQLSDEIEARASGGDRDVLQGLLRRFQRDSRRTYNVLLDYVKIEFLSCEEAS